MHPKKHALQRMPTEDGIQMLFNASQLENSLVSIRVSLESDSNLNDESEYGSRSSKKHSNLNDESEYGSP
jgi:hypothetical protein